MEVKFVPSCVKLYLAVLLLQAKNPCGSSNELLVDHNNNHVIKSSRGENVTHPFQYKLRPQLKGVTEQFPTLEPASSTAPPPSSPLSFMETENESTEPSMVHLSHEQLHMWKFTVDGGPEGGPSTARTVNDEEPDRPESSTFGGLQSLASSTMAPTISYQHANLPAGNNNNNGDTSDRDDGGAPGNINSDEFQQHSDNNNNNNIVKGRRIKNTNSNSNNYGGTGSPSVETHAGCPSCMLNQQLESSLPSNIIRQMRLEVIKEQILRKLGLTEPPDTANLPKEPIPLPVAQGSTLPRRRHPHAKTRADKDVDDYYGKTEQVIIFPEDAIPRCGPETAGPSACFTFKIPQENPTEEQISSAELWVYKLADGQNETLWLDEISYGRGVDGSEYTRVREIDIKYNYYIREGWVKLNLSNVVPRWMERDGLREAILQIGCNGCDASGLEQNGRDSPIDLEGEQRPFIVINFKSALQKKRSRRSLTCSPSLSECCRESFVVSFREIGWDSWIIGPSEYNAYFCKGSCVSLNSFVHSSAKHTTVMQKYIRTFGITNRTKEIIPCCTASKMSSISLIYRDPNNLNNTVKKETLPNMVVDSCGCL